MGQEITCVAHYGDQTGEGKAMLESEEVIFRGPFRARVRLAEVTSVRDDGGRLSVATPEGELTLELGAAAAKWAEKIRNPRTLLDKLGVKAGMRVSIVGLADEGFVERLRGRGVEIQAGAASESDIVFLYAPSVTQLEQLFRLRDQIKRNGAIWVVSPKGDRAIQDLHVIAAGKAAGLVDTKVAKFSETLTSIKFVIPVKDR